MFISSKDELMDACESLYIWFDKDFTYDGDKIKLVDISPPKIVAISFINHSIIGVSKYTTVRSYQSIMLFMMFRDFSKIALQVYWYLSMSTDNHVPIST